jgi:hypothetical protein
VGKVGELSGRAGQRGSRQDSSCMHWCRAGEGCIRGTVRGQGRLRQFVPWTISILSPSATTSPVSYRLEQSTSIPQSIPHRPALRLDTSSF